MINKTLKFAAKDFSDAIETLLHSDKNVKSVTIFCSPLHACNQRVTATWKQPKEPHILITYGRLNYAQKEWLALCKKAKCNPRRVWINYYPKKKG